MEELNFGDLPHSNDVVDESSIETLIEAKALGSRLRSLRLKRSMGLVELGQRAGLSASFLSQLETGRVVPTLRNLMRLGMVFDVDLSYFFSISNVSFFQTSKSKNRIRLSFGSKESPFMFSESMAAVVPDRKIVPCVAELRPGMDEAFVAHTFQGLEFVFVIEGEISLSTSQKCELLEAQDVVWIDGSVERQYRCVGDVAARVMIISFPFRP